jgi:hypothetical protein
MFNLGLKPKPCNGLADADLDLAIQECISGAYLEWTQLHRFVNLYAPMKR